MAFSVVTESLGAYAPYLLIVVAALALSWLFRSPPVDPREPPLVKPTIPIIGHAIGMLWYKMKYFEKLSTETPLPICSIPMFTSKVHIIMSPNYVQSALRSKNLSFDPFSMAFAERVLGAKSDNFRTVSYTPDDGKEVCYNSEMHKVYHEPLQPGPELQQTNGNMLAKIAEFMNEIGPDYGQRELYTWVRDSLTVATSYALFGSRNPVAKDPSLIEPFWDFEAGVQMLMLDFHPYITAHKPHMGRAKLQTAFRAYFNARYDLDDDVSSFIKRRSYVQRKYGFGSNDMGDFDLAMLMAATTNAIPTLFWALVHVLSSPSLVDSLRSEVSAVMATITDNSTGRRAITIDTSKFPTQCPLLCATYQETLRIVNEQMSVRVATADTVLSSPTTSATYLLKKDSVVLLPSGLHTTSPAVWGPDAHLFLPSRWLKRDNPTTRPAIDAKAKEAERLQKRAFFPFGGGKHLCPGRHFAFAEILGMIALFSVGFDVVKADGPGGGPGGAVTVPERQSRFLGEAIPKPVGGVDVWIRRREGFGDVRWGFETGGDGA